MIEAELETAILHHHKANQWPVGTIARFLRVHHSVVKRVIERDGQPPPGPRIRPSMLTPFQGFLEKALESYPNICGSRLHQMIKKLGYKGSEGHLRRNLLRYRPKRSKEAFLRLHMLPGEQAQADWADFGKVQVGKAQRRLMAFVIVLSWSRALYVRFFYSSRMREFLKGFVDAFEFFQGVPRTVLHDNLRSGVTERVGSFIRFNERFLHFAGHYGFHPDAANIRRGNEKGRVERSVQYIRTSFFEGRPWKDLDTLNQEALNWCVEVAGQRRWHEDVRKSVWDAFHEEKTALISLPPTPYPTEERVLVSVGKTPYARFDLNDYSVPASCIASNVLVMAGDHTVKIFEGVKQVAEHKRSFDKGMLIEDPKHIKEIVDRKKHGHKPSALKRLVRTIPDAEPFIQEMAHRQQHIGGVVSSLTHLMDMHGVERLSKALKEALDSKSYRLQTIHFLLKKMESMDHEIPTVALNLDESKPHAHMHVEHHPLESYDIIAGVKPHDTPSS